MRNISGSTTAGLLAGIGLSLVHACLNAGSPPFSDANWINFGGVPGADGAVSAAAVDSAGNVYIGGGFTAVGGIAANRIAKWDGHSWSALGSGVSGGPPWGDPAGVFALAASGNNVYAAGNFTTAGGIAVSYIAKWDGNSWSALGSGMDDEVDALAASGGDLYAGGTFTTAGGIAAKYIAKWDGSTWSALGLGMNDWVSALAVLGSNVYAGGWFTGAGDSPANYIAKWDGSSWSEVGYGMAFGISTRVDALAVSGSDLYVGGDFTKAGDIAANYVAKWDGSNWSALGSGTGTYGYVHALAVSGSNVYVGGDIRSSGGPGNHIAKWDGSSWSALGSGINGTVEALAVSGSDLYAGGLFTTAGDKASEYIARAYLLPLPVLSLRLSSATQGSITIFWPSADTSGFSLEQASTPITSASWVSNTAIITDDGISKSVTLPATNSSQVFRLRGP
jgi:hypothetical protein